jgi:DNA-binding transcriptional LysR family regulator
MELRHLSYFVAVAEEGQVTRAAARLSVAQPAVSAQLRRLERELGEPLFHRDQRGVRLTGAGEAFLPHARAALAAAERGRDAIMSLRGLLTGNLRVGVVRPVDRRFAAALGAFHRAHPAVAIAVVEEHNDPLLEALGNGEVDVALVGTARRPPPPVRTRVIASEPLVVGLRRDHPLAHRRAVTLAALREEPMITLTRESGLRAVLENACREAGFSPRIAVEAGELRGLAELAAEGLGVGIAPRSAFEEADVAIVRLTRPALQRRTALAWVPEAASPAGRAFVALIIAHFAGPA